VEKDGGKGSPLTGIRVLDLTDEKASFCSKVLADLGAQVAKMEKPGGDTSRKLGPYRNNSGHPSESLSFLYNNANKLGITLNLETSIGRELFARLVRNTDVLVESFPPGYLDELGLSFGFLNAVNPRIIVVSVSPFGQNGPRRGFKSCDLVASALGGQMYVCGSPSLPPIKAYGQQSYLTASLYAALGVLLALRKRAKTGKGDHIDISIQETTVGTLEHVMIRYFHEQVIAKRSGTRHWNDFFCVLPCKDGFIHLTPFVEWETLVDLLENEGKVEDLKDERWKNEPYRKEHFDHVIDVLGKWTGTHKVDELFQLGQLMRLPWAPIQRPNEILGCPQLIARDFFVDLEQAESGSVLKYPGLPYRFSPRHSLPRKRAPLVGEDNMRVYRGELGLNKEEFETLTPKGII
jgi:crotonobetainyl-CoA:carnitine CoA-transferase CaiB-like acyl-CoA transferase